MASSQPIEIIIGDSYDIKVSISDDVELSAGDAYEYDIFQGKVLLLKKSLSNGVFLSLSDRMLVITLHPNETSLIGDNCYYRVRLLNGNTIKTLARGTIMIVTPDM